MRTVGRALGVLHALAAEPTGMTLQQLASKLDVPVPSMHRVLAVLAEDGYIVRSPVSRRYFVGPKALEISTAAVRARRLHQIPPAAIARAAIVTGDTVFITELCLNRAVCVAIAPGRRPVAASVALGSELPLHASAAGRVLLLDMTDGAVSAMLTAPLPTYTDATPSSVPALLAALRRARHLGFDICAGEFDLNVWAVSAPIRDRVGAVRASVTLITRAQRGARPNVRDTLIAAVMRVAEDLSASAVGSSTSAARIAAPPQNLRHTGAAALRGAT